MNEYVNNKGAKPKSVLSTSNQVALVANKICGECGDSRVAIGGGDARCTLHFTMKTKVAFCWLFCCCFRTQSAHKQHHTTHKSAFVEYPQKDPKQRHFHSIRFSCLTRRQRTRKLNHLFQVFP